MFPSQTLVLTLQQFVNAQRISEMFRQIISVLAVLAFASETSALALPGGSVAIASGGAASALNKDVALIKTEAQKDPAAVDASLGSVQNSGVDVYNDGALYQWKGGWSVIGDNTKKNSWVA